MKLPADDTYQFGVIPEGLLYELRVRLAWRYLFQPAPPGSVVVYEVVPFIIIVYDFVGIVDSRVAIKELLYGFRLFLHHLLHFLVSREFGEAIYIGYEKTRAVFEGFFVQLGYFHFHSHLEEFFEKFEGQRHAVLVELLYIVLYFPQLHQFLDFLGFSVAPEFEYIQGERFSAFFIQLITCRFSFYKQCVQQFAEFSSAGFQPTGQRLYYLIAPVYAIRQAFYDGINPACGQRRIDNRGVLGKNPVEFRSKEVM